MFTYSYRVEAAGTPEEEGSEAEGAPSSSSGRREGGSAQRAKRPRLVWTMELNKRFLDAVMHLVRACRSCAAPQARWMGLRALCACTQIP